MRGVYNRSVVPRELCPWPRVTTIARARSGAAEVTPYDVAGRDRPAAPDFDCRNGVNHAGAGRTVLQHDEYRYLSDHRYSGCDCALQLHRAVGGGHGTA